MLLAVRLADALEPRIQRLVMELYGMIGRRFKFVRVEVLDYAFLPASSDGLCSCLPTSEHFNMDHIVLLRTTFLVEVDG